MTKSWKLLALDMDGTLLDDEHRVPRENAEAIQRARRAGIEVVLASGRHIDKVRDYRAALQLPMPVVTTNGCEIWGADDKLIHREKMSWQDVQQFRQIGARLGIVTQGYAAEGVFRRPEEFPEEQEALQLNWLMMLYRESDENKQAELLKALRETGSYEISMSGEHKIDVNPPGVSKASGLQHVCSLYGIRAEEVAAVGDGLNDKALLRWAGLGVAMGNAPEELKHEADWVTAPYDQFGVAKLIERLLDGSL
ncbi:Cof-type HAD-IIB family hydrolase [Paenibacillus sp. y28]|uniref:Cof-type HAD-IIB family hydrolase n=1 Tax=Paenibacillus sp. y28 TaxID=3129110 RepID=UPI00301682F2